MDVKAVLFDLEGTLVDVTAVSHHRKKNWKAYASGASQTTLYPGVMEMLHSLKHGGVKIAIVTNIVSFAANAVIDHHRIPTDLRICFHDVTRAKPAPEMAVKALASFGITAAEALGVGDTSSDAGCFAAAMVNGYCAGWNAEAETMAQWTGVLDTPTAILGKSSPWHVVT